MHRSHHSDLAAPPAHDPQRHKAIIERDGCSISITCDDPSVMGWAHRVLTILSRRSQRAGHNGGCRYPAVDLTAQLDLHDLADRIEQLVHEHHHRSPEGLLVSWLAESLSCSQAEIRGAAKCSTRMNLVTHAAGPSMRWECVRLHSALAL